jgi:hypothetical protein
MKGLNIGNGLRQINTLMGTTIEVNEEYICRANHTHYEIEELIKEMKYIKDFLIYKGVMIDNDDYKKFCEAQEVANRLKESK